MDGLKYGRPGYEPHIEPQKKEDANQMALFDDEEMHSLKEKRNILPQEKLCLIKDFMDGVNLKKATLSPLDFHDLSATQVTFKSLLDNKK
jgi:hypothetical protein